MDRIVIGIVAKPQGLKGELKINPITDDISRFKKLKNVYLCNQKYLVQNVSIRGNFVVLKLDGLNDIEQVEKFRQCELEVDRCDAVELKKDEYFMADLINAKLMSEDGTYLGVVKNIDKFGAAFVVTILDEINSKEFMFPYLNDVVVKVDIENKIIVCNMEKLEEVRV